MGRFACVLRGINVGGRRKLKMIDLKAQLTQLGFENIETYIQSGNVVFDSQENDAKKIEEIVTNMISDVFDLEVPVVIRSKKDFLAMLEGNPHEVNENSIKSLHLIFLKSQPEQAKFEEILSMDVEGESLNLVHLDLILKCGEKYSQVKLNNAFVERKLKVSSTTRNWKTIVKIKDLL